MLKKYWLIPCISMIFCLCLTGCGGYSNTIVQHEDPGSGSSSGSSSSSLKPVLPLKTQTLSWYVVRNKDHKHPRPNTEGGFDLRNYDAYYIGKGDKVVFLTFDEGYENGFTPQILDTLKKHAVPAAFFVTEPYIDSNPELIRRMVNEGHIVGNHSKTHPSMPAKTADKEAFQQEIEATAASFYEETRKKMPYFFRPPRGEFSEKSLSMTKEMGYKTIFWSFAYEDWLTDKQPSPEMAYKKIMDNTHNGEIMLLHAVSSTNTEILDRVITDMKSQGYRFEPLTTLK